MSGFPDFNSGGTPLTALRTAYRRHQIAICNAIRLEVTSALVRKFHWSEKRLADAFADYSESMFSLPIPEQLHRVCRDPNDDVIVECAVIAGADFIVTGDKDLLSLRQYQGIRIVTPREFLDEFETRPAK